MIGRTVALLTGLSCYGLSMAMMVRAELGLDPWDVFHQGLSRHTPMTIGVASAVVGVAVLLAWIPLRNKPGVGTVANVVVIAVTVDAALAVLHSPQSLPARVALMLGAVMLNAVATVLYVGAGLGPVRGTVDDGSGCAQRTFGATGAHLHRGRRAGGGVAARRQRGRGHRGLCPRHRTAGSAGVAGDARIGAGPKRLGADPRRPGTCPASRVRHDGAVSDSADAVDPDLLIDFRKVSLRRGGRVLVGPITWQVELDERWVVIGPNGAGKTSLLRIAAAMEHPSSGTAYVLGERLGRVDMAELRQRIGLSSSALSQRIPDNEVVRDLVVSAGYAVLGRWRETLRGHRLRPGRRDAGERGRRTSGRAGLRHAVGG